MASAQVEAFRASLLSGGAKIVKAFILEVDAELKKPPSAGGTPVKTGHARASWIPSVGDPATGEASGSSLAAHDAGLAAVLRYKLTDGAAWVSNNVPYIGQLNYGASSQAPAGFIEGAIDRAIAAIEQRFELANLDIDTMGAGSFADAAGESAAGNIASAYSPFGGSDD